MMAQWERGEAGLSALNQRRARRFGGFGAKRDKLNQVLAAALAAQADLIVSGDAHLLDLKRLQGIDIVAAAIAVERIAPAA